MPKEILPGNKRYSLKVVITKTDDSNGATEHEATVSSHNLDLEETKDMTLPLLAVLEAWVKKDAE